MVELPWFRTQTEFTNRRTGESRVKTQVVGKVVTHGGQTRVRRHRRCRRTPEYKEYKVAIKQKQRGSRMMIAATFLVTSCTDRIRFKMSKCIARLSTLDIVRQRCHMILPFKRTPVPQGSAVKKENKIKQKKNYSTYYKIIIFFFFFSSLIGHFLYSF